MVEHDLYAGGDVRAGETAPREGQSQVPFYAAGEATLSHCSRHNTLLFSFHGTMRQEFVRVTGSLTGTDGLSLTSISRT